MYISYIYIYHMYISYIYITFIYTHKHSRPLFSLKKVENLGICDNIDEPGKTLLSEMSQTEKDKYYMVSLTCGL